MNVAVRALMDRAHEDLRAARHNLAGGFVRAALNRAYYAAFNAARAALLTVNESPKSHSGVRSRFGKQFVDTGRFPESASRVLAQSETLRNRADYEAFSTFDPHAAAGLIADVGRFVEAVEALIRPGDET